MELSSLRYFNEIKYLKRHSFYFKEIKKSNFLNEIAWKEEL